VITILIEALKCSKTMDAEVCEELLDALKVCFQIDLELELPEKMRFQYFFEIKGGFDSLEAL
jgi:hypothetical protein